MKEDLGLCQRVVVFVYVCVCVQLTDRYVMYALETANSLNGVCLNRCFESIAYVEKGMCDVNVRYRYQAGSL